MPDIEKVIALLERYVDIPNLAGVENYGAKIVDMPAPLITDAIVLLKAQEPVEPVFERQFMSSIEIYDCGKCGTSLGAKGIAKYCMKCGQAVKWDA